ncbi:AAA family ATPase [[Clostridium] innocuum]|nr:AAA family ATPase [Erysipelotrichaceae bacterium]MCR0383138.1 AAA family ATPase [[Clostridium] innocuum]MCR0412261.1 AAA family ATPase [[Clostridium] innocuum]MCR0533872.1 AAA family ATPase [[Clostridium] innocuum]MCR0537957.1 AAA family ATPase [[Clostridium] innocuum]
MQNTDLKELLDYIDPASLNYQEWVNVGMALKYEGYTAADWDAWSMQDSGRYHKNECFKKWDTFKGTGIPVTGATITQMAKDRGWQPMRSGGRELDWNDVISGDDDLVIVDKGWIEGKEIQEPKIWNPVKELSTYLEILFDSDENVGYVTRSWVKEGKHLPTKGCCDRTAGQLIQELQKCNGDIGRVLGDYNPEAGAWIRFNPLDGKGGKNENVVDWRYALVESDSMDLAQQNAIIRELELPVACLVYSGGKSIHAIVHIDAADYHEYRKRVDYLYTICKKNGLEVDQQNKNPSRLSRMPGVTRNGKKQFLIDTNIGKASWNEWQEWIESVNDELPEPESLEDYWDNLPDLAPPLIDGVLRQGHKMLIAGPSKAGKSFALIEMCIAIAEGMKWFGWPCTQGKVMYVNLELDRASCLHRFKDVYQELHIAPRGLKNIDIWNLRGKSIPMDKLAPKLIRRAAKKNYIAIIIDPIYKVITGDENSADQMANFCNQFDKVCTELGCAVVYCHHHSKGSQGGKRSMDRASGSGVFARDPDALLDLIELDVNENLVEQQSNRAVCDVCMKWLQKYGKEDIANEDDQCSEKQMLAICRVNLKAVYEEIIKEVAEVRKQVQWRTAWRIEGTLREFPKFEPVNLWFDYPVHKVDQIGVLKDVIPDDVQTYKKNFKKKKSPDDAKKERIKAVETAYEACGIDEKVTVKALSEYMGVGEKTVRNRLKEHGGYWIDEGIVGKK